MRLSYVTFIAQDVDLMAEFYIAALGLEEVAESRDHRYREVKGGGCMIGFAMAGVRAALNLPEAQPTGTRALLTFFFSLMQSGLLFLIERNLLGLSAFHLLWLHELLRAVVNTVVAVPVFLSLDRFKRQL